jgi:hypothetical protein
MIRGGHRYDFLKSRGRDRLLQNTNAAIPWQRSFAQNVQESELSHLYGVQIQKEVIFDLKSENQFLSKEIWESCQDFTAHDIMESLSEFSLKI